MGAWTKMAVVCLALPLGLLQQLPQAGAMPRSNVAPAVRADVIDVQTVCDYRGCFGFGQRQWYRPPSYRPPGYQAPGYYRPRAAGTPRLLYQPPTARAVPAPLPSIKRMPTTASRHAEWCMGRYRSYNPATNRYRSVRGVSQVCQSPYE